MTDDRYTVISGDQIEDATITAEELASKAVTVPKLDIDNSYSDKYTLVYDNTTGKLKWSPGNQIRVGLFDLDSALDFQPADTFPVDMEKDGNNDIQPSTTENLYTDPEYELDGNGDIMPKEI